MPCSFDSCADRFWSRVERRQPQECWPWIARKNYSGYGDFSALGTEWRSHRVAWSLANDSEIPDGACVLHSCDSRNCCNPAHLRLGAPADNARDREADGTTARGERHGSKTMPWTVPRMPGEKNHQAKLSEEGVRDILRSYTGAYGELTNLAHKHGVSPSTVYLIVNRKKWQHVLLEGA